MSLFFKPHTVLVASVSESKSGTVANNLVFDEAVEVLGQMTAKDMSIAYESFGVESKQPHKFMTNLDNAYLFTVGSRVTWDGRTFAVVSPVRISKHGLVTDHAAVMLEELA